MSGKRGRCVYSYFLFFFLLFLPPCLERGLLFKLGTLRGYFSVETVITEPKQTTLVGRGGEGEKGDTSRNFAPVLCEHPDRCIDTLQREKEISDFRGSMRFA